MNIFFLKPLAHRDGGWHGWNMTTSRFMAFSAFLLLAPGVAAAARTTTHSKASHDSQHKTPSHAKSVKPASGKNTHKPAGKKLSASHAEAKHKAAPHPSVSTARSSHPHKPVMVKHHAVAAAAVAAGAAAATAAAAEENQTPLVPAPAPERDLSSGSSTGLPLPRYAAFRSDLVNVRVGPGMRYPIDWSYHRRGLPVKIEREFDVWRLVEDSDGVKGWVHQAVLSGVRDFVIPSPAGTNAVAETVSDSDEKSVGHMQPRLIGRITTQADLSRYPNAVLMHSDGGDDASVVAVLLPGTVGTVKLCSAGAAWCKVSVHGYDGWIERRKIWGVTPDEALPTR